MLNSTSSTSSLSIAKSPIFTLSEVDTSHYKRQFHTLKRDHIVSIGKPKHQYPADLDHKVIVSFSIRTADGYNYYAGFKPIESEYKDQAETLLAQCHLHLHDILIAKDEDYICIGHGHFDKS